MKINLVRFTALALACAIPGTLATAAAAVTATPGMVVKDGTGKTVGSIVAVAGDTVTIRTSKHDIPVPASSFAQDKNFLLIGMSGDQLDAAFEKAAAAASAAAAANQASLAVGASVKGSGGTAIGTIAAIEDANVIIQLEDGTKVAFPKTGIAARADGAIIGMTADQLKAQIAPSGQ